MTRTDGEQVRARVALVAHRLAAATATGVGRYYVELVRGLADVAGDLELVAASPREDEAAHWLPDRVEHVAIGRSRKLTAMAWAALGRPLTDRALAHPALVHSLHAWAPVPTSAPLVVTVHDVMPLRHPDWYSAGERWSCRRALSQAAERAAVVIADSATEGHNIATHAGIDPARVRVVPLGVGNEFRVRSPEHLSAEVCARHGVEPGTYLVAVGAVSARKNLEVVLQALARLRPRGSASPELLVIGPAGHGSARAREEVERLGLADRVRFAGYVAHEDVPVLVGSASGLVHPSLDEGFGLTPLEGMAAQVPVITSDGGSLPEVAGPGATVVRAGDVDGWAAAISDLEDPERRVAAVASGDSHQRNFTWDRTARETASIYREVLARR